MKKIIILYIFLSILICNAQDIKTVIVGSDPTYYPYHFLNEKGEPSGFAIELLDEIGKEMNIKFIHCFDKWDRVMKNLEKGNINMVSGLFKTEDRVGKYLYSISLFENTHSLFVKKGTDIKTFEDIYGKTIMFQNGGIAHEYMVKNKIPGKYVLQSSIKESVLDLRDGKADVLVLPTLIGKILIKQYNLKNIINVGSPILHKKVCFGLNKNNTELLAIINEGINIVKISGAFDRIYNKWLGIYERKTFVEKYFRYIEFLILIIIIIAAFLLIKSKKTLQRKGKELIEIENKFKSLFYSMNEIAVIHKIQYENGNPVDYKIVEANKAYEDLVGMKSKDFTGKLASEIYQSEIPPYLELYYSVVRDKKNISFETYYAPMNKYFYISVIYMKKDIFATITNDITEIKNTQKKVEELSDSLEKIINAFSSALISVDSSMEIYKVNEALIKKIGLNEKKIIGRNFSEIFENYREIDEKIKACIKENISEENIPKVIFKNNKNYYENISIYPVKLDQGIGAVIIIDDDTDRINMQQTMVQTEKMMSVGGLAAGMAHEINNPLSGIITSVQNIERRIDENFRKNKEAAEELGLDIFKFKEYLQKREIDMFLRGIKLSSLKASDIIKNMLEFSRKSDLEKLEYNIVGIIDDSLEISQKDYDFIEKYDFRHITVEKNYSSDNILVKCNKQEIEQVIINIFKNAAQALFEENVEDKKIAISIKTEDDVVIISIKDNGPGMDKDVKKRIFEPFYTTKDVNKGTGLGLSVSYFIITDNHKGSLDVISSPGKGSEFIIKLFLTEGK